jgi:hypothetical protein
MNRRDLIATGAAFMAVSTPALAQMSHADHDLAAASPLFDAASNCGKVGLVRRLIGMNLRQMFASDARQVPRVGDRRRVSVETPIEAFDSFCTSDADEIEQMDGDRKRTVLPDRSHAVSEYLGERPGYWSRHRRRPVLVGDMRRGRGSNLPDSCRTSGATQRLPATAETLSRIRGQRPPESDHPSQRFPEPRVGRPGCGRSPVAAAKVCR